MVESPLSPFQAEAVVVAGPDAFGFLQRILTCDLRGGRAALPGCLLGADGRIRHEVVVVGMGPQRHLLLSMEPIAVSGEGYTSDAAGGGQNPPSLFATLDGYHFTEKVELEAKQAWLGVVRPDQQTAGANGVVSGAEDFIAGRGPLRVGQLFRGHALDLLAYPDSTAPPEELSDFPALLPMLGRHYGHGHLPLEVGLKACVSFTKGCFPGQEIMARIENLGHPAKVLVRADFEYGDEAGNGRLDATAGASGLYAARDAGEALEATGHVVARNGRHLLCMVKWKHRLPGTALFTEGGEGGVLATVTGQVEKYGEA